MTPSYFCHSLLILICVITNGNGQTTETADPPWNITFSPEHLLVINEGKYFNITVEIISLFENTDHLDGSQLLLQISNQSPNKLNLISSETKHLPSDILVTGCTLLVEVRGRQVGKSSLTFDIEDRSGLDQGLNSSARYQVHVLIAESVLNSVFEIGVLVASALNVFAFSCRLKMDKVKAVFTRPVGLIIGFFLQYGLLPGLAFGMGKAFQLSNAMAFGLFCLSSCPGGGVSNVWTLLLRGEMDLSISMTLISTIASLGMMPLWLFTLGRIMMEDVRSEVPGARVVAIPFVLILVTIALVAVPCILGLLIARFAPRAGRIISRVIRPVAILFLLFQVVLGAVTRSYIFDYFGQWRIMLGCMLVPYTAMLVSLGVALAARQGLRRARTIMVETAVQNSALAIAVVLTALPRPDADIALVAPMVAIFANPIPLSILTVCIWIRRCYRRRKTKPGEGKVDDSRQNIIGESKDLDLQDDVADMKYLTGTGAMEDKQEQKNNNNIVLVKQTKNGSRV